jgi:hypothetical protein
MLVLIVRIDMITIITMIPASLDSIESRDRVFVCLSISGIRPEAGQEGISYDGHF